MPDDRSLKEKLEAMANQEDSPNEAEIARALLRQMLGFPEPGDSRVLSRASILGTPDRDQISGTRRMQTKDGTWYTIDLDEMEINIEPVIEGLR